MAVLILSVGRDATLLAVRSLILANAGYDVVAVSEKEFAARFQNGDSTPSSSATRCRTISVSASPSWLEPTVLLPRWW